MTPAEGRTGAMELVPGGLVILLRVQCAILTDRMAQEHLKDRLWLDSLHAATMHNAGRVALEVLADVAIQFGEQFRRIRDLADVALRRQRLPFEETLAAAGAIPRHLPRTEDEAGENISSFADLGKIAPRMHRIAGMNTAIFSTR